MFPVIKGREAMGWKESLREWVRMASLHSRILDVGQSTYSFPFVFWDVECHMNFNAGESFLVCLAKLHLLHLYLARIKYIHIYICTYLWGPCKEKKLQGPMYPGTVWLLILNSFLRMEPVLWRLQEDTMWASLKKSCQEFSRMLSSLNPCKICRILTYRGCSLKQLLQSGSTFLLTLSPASGNVPPSSCRVRVHLALHLSVCCNAWSPSLTKLQHFPSLLWTLSSRCSWFALSQ